MAFNIQIIHMDSSFTSDFEFRTSHFLSASHPEAPFGGFVMYIRRLLDDEYEDVVKLIVQTVHTVCADDYTKEELDAWAPSNFDVPKFRQNLSGSLNLAAFEKGKLVGFISLERNGYINRLYTHKDFLHRGIGEALFKKAESWAKENGICELSLDSSKTAEGFYLKMGFEKAGISTLSRGGVVLRNTVMKKVIKNGEVK